VTHQALEDVAIMRATPNMTVLETGDATEVESVLDVAQSVNGPVYVRMLRGVMPRLFPRTQPMQLDRVRVLADGDDVTLLSAGIETEEERKAVRALASRGVGVRHLHVSTHKPFDDPEIIDSLRQARYGIVTVENHSVVGGLGSAVAERMAETALGIRLVRVGLRDTYAHGASRGYLLREYGLDAITIVRAVEELLGASTGLVAADIPEDAVASVGPVERADSL
jgi:transketolase